jgi:hypothetical protein
MDGALEKLQRDGSRGAASEDGAAAAGKVS